jgi:hypothetical protein
MPERVGDDVVLVDVYGGKPDDFGRSSFFAYWAQDTRWRGGGLIAGQVFITRLDEFAARWDGKQILVMTDDGNIPLKEWVQHDAP